MIIMKAILALADGKVFEGRAFGAEGEAIGEVVFNTSMTGYQEILTDPSYEGQLVAMTYPQIGNVGVNLEDVESRRPFVQGLHRQGVPATAEQLARDASRCTNTCRANGIVGIQGIDTRSLVRHLRDHGAQEGIISTLSGDRDAAGRQGESVAGIDRQGPGAQRDLRRALRLEPRHVGTLRRLQTTRARKSGSKRRGKGTFAAPAFSVVAYDYGIKYNILRNLAEAGCRRESRSGVDMPLKMCWRSIPTAFFSPTGRAIPTPCPTPKRTCRD